MADYNQYRNQQRAVCKGLTAEGREARQHLMVSLRQKKKEIRVSALSWPDKKVCSPGCCQSVIEVRTLKLSIQQRRQEVFPRISAHGLRTGPTKGTRAPPHNFADGDMRNQRINGCLMQGWKRTRCTSVYRLIMTEAQTGPTLRNNALQPNKSNRPLSTRLPRRASDN